MTAVMNNQNQIESVTTSAYARISKPVPKSSAWRPIIELLSRMDQVHYCS
jgi:hypothetical protein